MSKRRQSKGHAWHWDQTDSWYYTVPGTKRRVPLLDERQRPIRGREQKLDAELALARLKVAGKWRPTPSSPTLEPWLVARACSEYLQEFERRAAQGTLNLEHKAAGIYYLNDFCSFCGALPISELRKRHVELWLERHPTWQSPVTRKNAVTFVLAAINAAEEHHGIVNPLRGLKKPPSRPRLQSFLPEEEAALYGAADEALRRFLFAAIHTGLRPFCELARLTADAVVETERGMMWRVRSSKTLKTRKIPVRPEVAQLTRALLQGLPAGQPLFGNSTGKRWRRAAGGAHFRRARKTLGWEQHPVKRHYSCYTARHTFAHRMLSGYWNGGKGCSIETLAELMGDTPKVAFDHYGKEWGQHYQEPLWAAIGVAAHSVPRTQRCARNNSDEE
jgi:integrase